MLQTGCPAASHSQDVRQIVVDGVGTRVAEAGDPSAPPVVLLHGTGGHLEAFDRNVAALAANHRVMRYDLPGHGWSAAPERSYEVDGYVTHLTALLDTLEIPSAHLVGASLGGWIAARLALTAPERAGRLVLVAPGGVLADPVVMRSLRTLSVAATAKPTPAMVRTRLEWLMADPASVPDHLVETRLAIYTRPGAAEAMAKVLCLQDPVIRARNLLDPRDWGRLRSPTLVLWGDADATGPATVGARLASWIPGARFVRMAGAGHWPQFETPAAFDAVVHSFLTASGEEHP